LLERYLVPGTLLADGHWLRDYLQRRLDAARSATDPIDAFVPTADADRLMEAWTVTPRPLMMAPRQWEDDPSIAEALATLHAIQRERDALLASTSWRITSPLRRFTQAVGLAGLRRYRVKDRNAPRRHETDEVSPADVSFSAKAGLWRA
jgi:hypothetical protein